MYENKRVPVTAPERFRVELSFSPGSAHNPIQVVPARNNHALPVVPRVALNQVGGRGGRLEPIETNQMGRILRAELVQVTEE